MGVPNWGKLYREGRCKDIGVSWSEEEARAVFLFGVPAEYARRGALTAEDVERLKKEDSSYEKKHGEAPLEALDTGELYAKANELGVEFSPATPDSALVRLVELAQKKSSKPAPKRAKKNKK